MRIVAVLLAAGGAFLAGCSAMADKATLDACSGVAANVVCTTQGAIKGVPEGATVAFKDIPYAAPPVGKLRWQAPQPAQPWTGILDGTKFGAVCPKWRVTKLSEAKTAKP